LCGPGNLKALPLENIFQPIEWQVIGELAGHDESQKPWAGKAFLDCCLCFGGYFDLRVLAGTFATGARILFAYMLETFEMSGMYSICSSSRCESLCALHRNRAAVSALNSYT